MKFHHLLRKPGLDSSLLANVSNHPSKLAPRPGFERLNQRLLVL